MKGELQVRRCSRKAPTNFCRQEAFTFTVCGVTAGGSGIASMEADTINTIKTNTPYESDFIPYCAEPIIADFPVDQLRSWTYRAPEVSIPQT